MYSVAVQTRSSTFLTMECCLLQTENFCISKWPDACWYYRWLSVPAVETKHLFLLLTFVILLTKEMWSYECLNSAHVRLFVLFVEASWNVMTHVQKPDFVFRRNGRNRLNRQRGASVRSTTGSRVVRISGSNAGYTMFRGSVKSTGYPLHFPSVYHHISTGVYTHLVP